RRPCPASAISSPWRYRRCSWAWRCCSCGIDVDDPGSWGWCCWRGWPSRSEEHTSELQSRFDLVCRLLPEKKKRRTLAGQVEHAGLGADEDDECRERAADP